MATEQIQNLDSVAAAEPKVEENTGTKAKDKGTETPAKDPGCTCPVHPTLPPGDNFIEPRIIDIDDGPLPRSRAHRRGSPRRYYSPSPIRPLHQEPTILSSSTDLLAKVGNYDGIAEMPPCPTSSNIYLTTFPFTDRDVKRYGWLFANGVENMFLSEPSGSPDYDDFNTYPAVIHEPRRNRNQYYDEPLNYDISSMFLSRALDERVVKDTEKDVAFWIVSQNRNRQQGMKLLVAESRKAASIMCYYEALCGNSIVFVGAVSLQVKKMRGMKLKRVENLEEARALQIENEGIVGVVC